MDETLVYFRRHCSGASYLVKDVESELKNEICRKLMWVLDHELVGGFKKLMRSDEPGYIAGVDYIEVWTFETKAHAEFFQLKWR